MLGIVPASVLNTIAEQLPLKDRLSLRLTCIRTLRDLKVCRKLVLDFSGQVEEEVSWVPGSAGFERHDGQIKGRFIVDGLNEESVWKLESIKWACIDHVSVLPVRRLSGSENLHQQTRQVLETLVTRVLPAWDPLGLKNFHIEVGSDWDWAFLQLVMGLYPMCKFSVTTDRITTAISPNEITLDRNNDEFFANDFELINSSKLTHVGLANGIMEDSSHFKRFLERCPQLDSLCFSNAYITNPSELFLNVSKLTLHKSFAQHPFALPVEQAPLLLPYVKTLILCTNTGKELDQFAFTGLEHIILEKPTDEEDEDDDDESELFDRPELADLLCDVPLVELCKYGEFSIWNFLSNHDLRIQQLELHFLTPVDSQAIIEANGSSNVRIYQCA